MPPPLNGRQRRHLRSLAHHLEPVIQVGKEGVSPAVVAAADQALADHELIKVRLPQIDREERAEMASALERETGAALAGVTGRVAIYYRRHPSEPKITLPR
ncbi:MAG: ribosome assembly RNA-binding protein YhbY [Sandaracinaceae bacterium]|nr:ribosome assembly RNA-binding protein YhbY [Sandaracinaceae bacterium]